MSSKERLLHLVSSIALSLALAAALTTNATASGNERVLHSFALGEGAHPDSTLIFDRAGNLYGTTQGSVFELSPNSTGMWDYKVLHSFCSQQNCTDGDESFAGVTFDEAGNLYGTTFAGGQDDYGTVFELKANADGSWTESVLHSFTAGVDGHDPQAGVIMDGAGNIYGTTTYGGGQGTGCQFAPDCGTVFELSPAAGGGWTESVLYRFMGTSDGGEPLGGLAMDNLGNLYGTTTEGGFTGGYCQPYGCGTVFELSPNPDGTWKETVLHSFSGGLDGNEPFSGLVIDASGNLYGTTLLGGNTACGNLNGGCGTVFQLSPAGGGWVETVLHAFSGGSDGAYTYTGGVIMDSAGNLYGTTAFGGNSYGTVFQLRPSNGGWSHTVLYNFGTNDAHSPYAGLVFDKGGNLYGTTQSGGLHKLGAVFEVKP